MPAAAIAWLLKVSHACSVISGSPRSREPEERRGGGERLRGVSSPVLLLDWLRPAQLSQTVRDHGDLGLHVTGGRPVEAGDLHRRGTLVIGPVVAPRADPDASRPDEE